MNNWREHRRTISCVLPLLAFFILGSVLSALLPYQTVGGTASSEATPSQFNAARYFALIVTRVLVMASLIAAFARLYFKSFPLRVDAWGVVAGVVGAAAWIGGCH